MKTKLLILAALLLAPLAATHAAEPRPGFDYWVGMKGQGSSNDTELDGMDELYNLQDDPYEMNNLLQAGGADRTLKTMQAELARLLRETGGQAMSCKTHWIHPWRSEGRKRSVTSSP